ncbi:MAG: phosphatase PAP2 family protein [Candidatus Dormibacteria bacterium]
MARVRGRIALELRGAERRLLWLALVVGLAFVALTVAVAVHPSPFVFDRPLEVDVQGINWGPFGFWNDLISSLGGPVGLIAGAIVIALAYFLYRRAAPFVAFSALYAALYNGVNFLLRRPRPTGVPHTTPHLIGFAYPSGHVGFVFWVGLVFMILVARRFSRPWYVFSWVVTLVLVALAGVSRMFVGAHWPTDVLGGYLVVIAWSALSLSIKGLTRPMFGRINAISALAHPESRSG